MTRYLKRLLGVIVFLAIFILLISAILFPLTVRLDDGPPAWLGWVIYPAILLILPVEKETRQFLEYLID